MKENIQRFDCFLSGIVMPSIAVFIAWGFTTALLTPTDWMPNETLVQMVTLTQRFPLSILIAYTGDKIVYDVQGGMTRAAAAIDILAGTEDPVSTGAMIAGLLDGWFMKRVDGLLAGKIPTGFEILVNNFLVGISGALLVVFGCLAVELLYVGIRDALVIYVDFLVKCSLLSLTSLSVEPAKILFFNNAINRGVFIPLGTDQVAEAGKSTLFLIEASPGPGLGLLLAYSFFGKGAARSSAPNAVIIRFLDGIHETYLPYVLMNPLTVLAAMAGGMSGVFINNIFNSGLVFAASPGSIIAILGMCAKNSYIGVILSVIVVAAVSFVIVAFTLKFSSKNTDDNALEEASAVVSSMKGEAKDAKPVGTMSKVAFACDTGMRNSAIGVITLTERLNAARMKVVAKHFVLDDVPKDIQVIVTRKSLVERTETRYPSASISPTTNFMGGREYSKIVAQFTK